MKKQLALLSAITLALCGCASSIPGLLPGAESVTTSEQKPGSECKQLVAISAQQSGAFLTAQNLERGAMNQIRNATLQQHGNYLYITANYSDTYKNSLHNNAMSSVTIKGIAYQCPSKTSSAYIAPVAPVAAAPVKAPKPTPAKASTAVKTVPVTAAAPVSEDDPD